MRRCIRLRIINPSHADAKRLRLADDDVEVLWVLCPFHFVEIRIGGLGGFDGIVEKIRLWRKQRGCLRFLDDEVRAVKDAAMLWLRLWRLSNQDGNCRRPPSSMLISPSLLPSPLLFSLLFMLLTLPSLLLVPVPLLHFYGCEMMNLIVAVVIVVVIVIDNVEVVKKGASFFQ
jgi:hypothetical protein